MENIYESILALPREQWDYYYEIDKNNKLGMPFSGKLDYTDFIYKYFQRGGKVKVFRASEIDVSKLNRPNHICSVFFLGLLVYYGTSMHEKYPLGKNMPGYDKFPFIWFLIALFHDNAYSMEKDKGLKHIGTLTALRKHFNITHDLMRYKLSVCTHLATSRSNYFKYRRKHWESIDHGMIGGLLLYDRLVKIRREKQLNESQQERLYWDKSLEADYKLAAQAISLHNIWLAGDDEYIKIYKEYGLDQLINAPKVKFNEFPLYYLLSVADTIEPLKAYEKSKEKDEYILSQVQISFDGESIAISLTKSSRLDIAELYKRAKNLEKWLAINVSKTSDRVTIHFK